MKYLLDTHTFIWLMINPEKLSQKCKKLLISSENISVSSIALWEISIKFSLGKLDLTGIPPEELLIKSKEINIHIMDFDSSDAISYYKLLRHHKDPFDTMLVWQAIRNKITLISKDNRFETYPENGLQLIW
jgi:PIN domain nuclease of toxin-antitoxin system